MFYLFLRVFSCPARPQRLDFSRMTANKGHNPNIMFLFQHCVGVKDLAFETALRVKIRCSREIARHFFMLLPPEFQSKAAAPWQTQKNRALIFWVVSWERSLNFQDAKATTST